MPIKANSLARFGVVRDGPKRTEKEHVAHGKQWLLEVRTLSEGCSLLDQIETLLVVTFSK